jgi:multiple sugar transport system permease protein
LFGGIRPQQGREVAVKTRFPSRGNLPVTFVLPAVLWTTVFAVVPLIYSLPRSLQERSRSDSGVIESQWVGPKNYIQALTDREIRRAIRFSVAAAGLAVVGEVGLGLVLALAAHRLLRRRFAWSRVVLATPMLTAPVAVAYLSLVFFDQSSGMINLLLGGILPSDSIPRWRTDPNWSLVAIVLVDLWQWTPFCFLVLLATLETLPDNLFEAADVEGAGTWIRTFAIVLPLCIPGLVIVLLIRGIEALKIFDVPLVLTGGGPGTQTHTFTQWVWRYGLGRDDNYDFAAALGYLLLAPILAAGTVLVRLIRRTAFVGRQFDRG